jgi:murein tripeptide amidase MpaA
MLCKSISGLPIPIITVTSRKHRGIKYKKRQAIFLTARVHPGETNSNLVVDGFMEFLLSNEGMFHLLNNYIFKIIPCLNPDGNVCGNYRSSLAGVDLNRQWVIPHRELHPSVYFAKDAIS